MRPEPSKPVIPRISPGAIENEIFENVGFVVKFFTSTTFLVLFLSGGAMRVSETDSPVIAFEIV